MERDDCLITQDATGLSSFNKRPIHNAMDRLNRYFKHTFSIDLRALAAFRVGLATLVLVDLLNRITHIQAHYTDFGVLPRDILLKYYSQSTFFSFHLVSGSAGVQALLFLAAGVLAFLMMIGYKTRWTTFLSWVFLISLQNRNPLILQGGDVLFRVLFFWGMFLPLGAYYSIDSALTLKKTRQTSYFSLGSAALMLQIAMIYLFAIALKDGSKWWPEGTATYYALMIDHFTTNFGQWLLGFEKLLPILTFGVFFLEGSAFFLLMLPGPFWQIRFGTALALIFMHFGFGLAMRLGLFPFIDFVSLLIFFPPPVWNYLGKRSDEFQKGIPLKLYYDENCAFCEKMVKILKTLLLINARVLPAQMDEETQALMEKHNSWVVMHGSKPHVKFGAIITVVQCSPIFFWIAPILRLQIVREYGTKAYEWIANNRLKISPFTRTLLPYQNNMNLKESIWASVVIVFVFSLAAYWNVSNDKDFKVKFPSALKPIVKALEIDQHWNMFAPGPMTGDGWYVITGRLGNGKRVDVYREKMQAPTFDKPPLVSAMYASQRVRKYMMNIWKKKNQKFRVYYGKYLCRKWNKSRQGKKRLKNFQIHYMLEKTLPKGRTKPLKKVTLHKHYCYK